MSVRKTIAFSKFPYKVRVQDALIVGTGYFAISLVIYAYIYFTTEGLTASLFLEFLIPVAALICYVFGALGCYGPRISTKVSDKTGLAAYLQKRRLRGNPYKTTITNPSGSIVMEMASFKEPLVQLVMSEEIAQNIQVSYEQKEVPNPKNPKRKLFVRNLILQMGKPLHGQLVVEDYW